MATLETIERLVQELGPGWTEVSAVAEARPGAWAVLFGRDLAVGVEHEPDAGRLVISAELDRGAPEHRLAIYQAMLNYNALARETGGMRMGLLGPDREISIEAELPDEGLALGDLRRAVGHVAATARAWRAFVQDPGDGALPGLTAIRA